MPTSRKILGFLSGAGNRRGSADAPRPAPSHGSPVDSTSGALPADASVRLRLFEHAVENCPASILVTDARGTIQYVNQHCLKTTGFRLEELLGQNPRLFKSGRQPREFYHELWATVLSGRDWHGEMENRKKNGEFYWERSFITPIRDEHGVITHLLAIKQDITDSKRNESNLAWLAAMVENTDDVCVIKDLSHRVLAANSSYARLLGYASPYELAGLSIIDILRQKPDEDPLRSILEADIAARSLPPGSMITREENFDTDSEHPRVHFSRYFPIYEASGRLIATACISSDISERKKTERDLIRARDEAEAANRAKSAFLATMSHELRTPLNVINSVTSTLLEKESSPDQKRALQLVIEGGQSLLGIIEEILEYSGLQAGKIRLANNPFELFPLLMQALQLAQTSSRKKGLSLSYWVDSRVPAVVVGDEARLKQVLINLLHNAVKFTERGRVHFSVGITGPGEKRALRFAVLDTGIGLDSHTQERLFQPFTQADASIKRRFGGTGLGLVISQNYVTLMGGRITVRSRPNRGSVFQFEIPCHCGPDAKPVFTAYEQPGLRGKKLLVCTEHGHLGRLATAMARTWGMQAYHLQASKAGLLTRAAVASLDAILCEVPAGGAALAPWMSDLAAKLSATGKPPLVAISENGLEGAGSASPTHLASMLMPEALAKALSSALCPAVIDEAGQLNPPAAASRKARLGDSLPLNLLAADDIKTNRDAIRLITEHLGYKVSLVENGAEALSLLPHGQFDVLILDMQMPVLDGISTAREICRRYPDRSKRPKMIALTANALPGDAEQCLEAGMDAYLSKPIVPRQLAATLARLFASRLAAQPQSMPGTEPASAPTQAWIDTAHLEALTAGFEGSFALEQIRQLYDTFQKDYALALPQLQAACIRHDSESLVRVVHGIKGGALMLGWAQMGHSMVVFLDALRSGTFTGWESFPGEMDRLFQHSTRAMELWFAGNQHRVADQPSAIPGIQH